MRNSAINKHLEGRDKVYYTYPALSFKAFLSRSDRVRNAMVESFFNHIFINEILIVLINLYDNT